MRVPIVQLLATSRSTRLVPAGNRVTPGVSHAALNWAIVGPILVAVFFFTLYGAAYVYMRRPNFAERDRS